MNVVTLLLIKLDEFNMSQLVWTKNQYSGNSFFLLNPDKWVTIFANKQSFYLNFNNSNASMCDGECGNKLVQ